MSAQLPLAEAVDQYCTFNTKVTSAGTRKLYGYAVLSYQRFLARSGIVADLNDVTFVKFREWRQAKVAHDTLRGECCKLLALWRWCASGKRRWIDEPEVDAPGQQYRAPQALDEKQLARLWYAAQHYRYRMGPVPGSVYLTALLYTLWDTSERIGAVHRIEADMVDLHKLWVTVPPSIRKGGKQGRAYKIRQATADAIARLREVYDGPTVFGAVDLRTVWHCFGHLRIAADLPRKTTPHTLRKSHASHLERLGGDARASLGHGSEATTSRHYLDPTITSRGKQPADLLFDPGRPADRPWWRRWG